MVYLVYQIERGSFKMQELINYITNMEPTEVLLGIAMVVVLGGAITSIFKKQFSDDDLEYSKELETYEIELENDIEKLEEKKQSLISQIKTLEETKVMLADINRGEISEEQNEVLNEYEELHIVLPVDIIEDLTYNKVTGKANIRKFIETKRKEWKQELSKKVNQGGVYRG